LTDSLTIYVAKSIFASKLFATRGFFPWFLKPFFPPTGKNLPTLLMCIYVNYFENLHFVFKMHPLFE